MGVSFALKLMCSHPDLRWGLEGQWLSGVQCRTVLDSGQCSRVTAFRRFELKSGWAYYHGMSSYAKIPVKENKCYGDVQVTTIQPDVTAYCVRKGPRCNELTRAFRSKFLCFACVCNCTGNRTGQDRILPCFTSCAPLFRPNSCRNIFIVSR